MSTTTLFDSSVISQAEEAMDFMANVLEASTECSIIGKDLDGKILLWNEGARRMYGYEPEVVDTGAGIKPEDQSKLFQAFEQLETILSRRHEGTGLGLHLSQKLASLIGGRIRLRSEFGKGSSFTLVLEEK